jgi:hypothetical protein
MRYLPVFQEVREIVDGYQFLNKLQKDRTGMDLALEMSIAGVSFRDLTLGNGKNEGCLLNSFSLLFVS